MWSFFIIENLGFLDKFGLFNLFGPGNPVYPPLWKSKGLYLLFNYNYYKIETGNQMYSFRESIILIIAQEKELVQYLRQYNSEKFSMYNIRCYNKSYNANQTNDYNNQCFIN
jgi:hypothetical protein